MDVNLDTIPLASQRSKWGEALAEVGLFGEGGENGPFSAEMQLHRSPSGSVFARLRVPPTHIGHRPGTASRSCVFVLLHQNSAGLTGEGLPLDAGHVCLADGAASWSVAFEQETELLVLRLPRERIIETMGRPSSGFPIPLSEGITARSAADLMRTLLASFGNLVEVDIVAFENALIALLTSSLRKSAADDGAITRVQAASFQRVMTEIEARLSQPDLSMRDVAARQGMSQRYLQKLFELHDTTFSDVVRTRRLDKARSALVDPAQKNAAIADIAFKCGFADQGNFSRVFRTAFGMSPRSYRSSMLGLAPESERLRGRPAGHAVALSAPEEFAAERRGDAHGAAASCGTYHLEVNADTVHWGFFSRDIPPVLHVPPGAEVVIETLTQHASDDWERMIQGDAGAESVFEWTKTHKNVDRRGAGPMDASVLGRGAGEGFGVHILTGPVHIEGAEPGDILEVQILDIAPRTSANPAHEGRAFASNASTWWGYQYSDYIDRSDRREVVTIFEVEPDGDTARAIYSYRWTPQTDPYGIRHDTIDYPGVPVDHSTVVKRHDPMPHVRIPLYPHFGCMAVAPKEHALVDSIPPGNFGGNLDNWRAGRGSTLYLPVEVPGALFSVGDGHLALGDGEINGTALEGSLTGRFRFELHKAGAARKPFLRGLTGPLLETPNELILHGLSYQNYLRDLGQDAQAEVYKRSSLDKALRSAFRLTRKFLMDGWGLNEDEAITLMSIAVDFGITQVADGNWGVHAVIRKEMFVRD